MKNLFKKIQIPKFISSHPNSEKLTYAYIGSIVGGIIGILLGALMFFLLNSKVIVMSGLDQNRENVPVGYFLIILLVTSVFGVFAGTLVGIGTPKFNPHPEQGK